MFSQLVWKEDSFQTRKRFSSFVNNTFMITAITVMKNMIPYIKGIWYDWLVDR